MRYRARVVLSALAIALAAMVVAACGSSSSSSSSSTTATIPLKPGEDPTKEALTGGKKGGTLTAYTSIDYAHFDPGESYYTLDYEVVLATQRPLVTFATNTSGAMVPDLATQVPTLANGGITDGGKTVIVHIQKGVHFSPPVNREVTSADVAYAIERGANPNVANPYFPTYFGSASPSPLVGASSSKYAGGPLAGLTTPDKYTIEFHLTTPGAATLIPALTLPTTSPVPKEFVAPLDKHSPTTFGSKYLVGTGPYMIQADSTGNFINIGYQPGKSLTLVRNPNWSGSTYTPAFDPPAYLDQIVVKIGGDPTVEGAQVLKGSHVVQIDGTPRADLKLAYNSYPSQLTITPGTGQFYAALDNVHGPFTNVNLRRAIWAATDRESIVKVTGGALAGEPMTHFIYPGNNGFAEAGGYAGPQVDYNKNVNGNMTVACKYMKLAGYPSCKYTGSATVQIVGASNTPFPEYTDILNSAATALGFHTHVTEPDQSAMFTKYCGTPKQEIDICPAVGWIRDFPDSYSILWAPFYGPAIVQTNNSNWGQVNNPQINAAMQQAALTVDPAARAAAWGKVDTMLVDQAVAVPEIFDNQPLIEAKDVAGVNAEWNQGLWDFAYTSLK
jgi:peptide/nickel transport system substrate-binding protein